MALTETALARWRGDSSSLRLSLVDADTGAAFNPTGSVLIFSIKTDAALADTEALVQKISTVGGFTVVSASAGTVDVSLVPADFAEITPEIVYVFDLQAQHATTAAVKTVCRGTIIFPNDVTKEVTLSIPTTTTNPGVAYTWANIPDKPATFPATVSPHTQTSVAGGASATLALTADARSLFATVACSGSGTAIVILSATNAVDGAFVAICLTLPATAGLTVELRNHSAGGTLLAAVATDGTAGTVGVALHRGATAWSDPSVAAWLD